MLLYIVFGINVAQDVFTRILLFGTWSFQTTLAGVCLKSHAGFARVRLSTGCAGHGVYTFGNVWLKRCIGEGLQELSSL